MSHGTALVVLLVAALLEAGGDALVRAGLRSPSIGSRALLFSLGAVVLFAYGWTVNAPPWDFGRLIGLYIVFFFIVAQIIAWIAFKETPSFPLLIGGGLIVTGGLVIALTKA